ncbi:hypothetical protein CICLE_v10006430mg [Citrus x clementina]|uniref:AAA+ ATPase domain-containing protein n=1 Tax=Citrus clementina TaxID=85681 RepID=V4RXP1_CITCL|nr:hypothetical protein CICLE_v10006430mg [Citrus x clementina]
MTLLLGPPGCGKTTLLSALSDNLSHSLKVSGEASYSGYILDEFDDLHIAEMTVRKLLISLHVVSVQDIELSIPGVLKIKANYNPTTWMLEVSSKARETQLGVDFVQIYRDSTWENKQLLKQLSSPSVQRISIFLPVCIKMVGSSSTHASGNGTDGILFWQQRKNMPKQYAKTKSFLSFLCAMSPLYEKNQQDRFNIVGALFISALLFGQRVLYRERFAGMYSPWPYSFAQILTLHVVVEVPYLFIRAIIYSMRCNLLYFNYLGMLVVALSPNVQVAYILTSSSYSMLNLFFGFNIPKPWWIRVYYFFPTSWAINGMLTSRREDIDEEILAFSESSYPPS